MPLSSCLLRRDRRTGGGQDRALGRAFGGADLFRREPRPAHRRHPGRFRRRFGLRSRRQDRSGEPDAQPARRRRRRPGRGADRRPAGGYRRPPVRFDRRGPRQRDPAHAFHQGGARRGARV
ncbi:MAG: hypothetical protein MZW92_75550 [Comamonadaceae bacterium]|nr:hypothetical protein [Comamonadaceae bacterium]